MSATAIRMSGEDTTLVRRLANLEDITIPDFARTAILEKTENSYDLHELRVAIAADDGQRFSTDEILEEL